MEKQCSKCRRNLPATAVYFYRHKNMKDGLNTVCKECEGHRFKEPRRMPIALKEGFKVCSKCKRELPETLEYFFKRKNGKNGLMSDCKECHGFKYMKKITYNDEIKMCPSCKKTFPHNSEWFNKNHRSKSGLQNICKSCSRKYGRIHHSLNFDKKRKYRQDHKEEIKEKLKIYRLNNPDIYRNNRHKREAKIKSLPNQFTVKEWKECKKFFNNSCAYCGKKEKLEQEHFIPLALDGEYTKQNIIPACKSCNASKQDKKFSDWYPIQSFYDKNKEEKILKYLGYQNGIQQPALLL